MAFRAFFAWLVAGTPEDCREFLGPWSREILTLADPDRTAIKGLGLEWLPALVQIGLDGSVIAAAEVLSDRQRQVLRMWAEGYDVPDIASRLAITAARVSDEKYKAVRKLRERLGIEASAA